MANGTDPLVGQLVDGRWRVLDRIGSGGFGVVYRAERIKLGKLVALKFLDSRGMQSEEAVARFEREARAISRVQHRHSVSILDFGVHQGRPYIVMEYLSGKSLGSEMGKPSMTPARGVQILSQVLEALKHAHASGVVHRDLKPDNVMLIETTGTEDYVKILDFGLARIISLDEPSISLPATVAGTPSYMSPEQARGEKPDHRTDLYSAGVILYGMCVGKKPFRSDDPGDLLRMHLNVRPEPPRKAAPERNISPALERVILRALEKKRDDRYYGAAEFLEALAATPEGRGSVRTRARRPARSRRVLGAVALVTMGAAGALAARSYFAGPARWTAKPEAGTTAAGTGTLTPTGTATATGTPTPTPTPTPTGTVSPTATGAPTGAGTTMGAGTPAATVAPPVATEDLGEAPVDGAVAAEPEFPDPPKVEPARAPPVAIGASEARVAELLDQEKLAEAEKLLLAEQILQPRAAWVHLDLGEIYFRRIWRRDAEREWLKALELEPALRKDDTLRSHLCAILGKGWKGAGERLIVNKIRVDAVEPMNECIRAADDLDRVRAAVRVIERVAGRSKVDRALVAARYKELGSRR
jgi:hypothetical protein